jgi:quinol monooxygenase YgiN
MITLSIRMKVLPDKLQEFMQTAQPLTELGQKERGCISCHLYQSIDNENLLNIVQEWKSKKDIHTYLESDNFSVLRGAMNHLLSEPPEIKIDEVAYAKGMEAVKSFKK